jgi:spore coat protein A
MISRRDFIQFASLAGASLILPARMATHAQHHDTSGSLGASPPLEPFVDALRIPPILKPKKKGKVDAYTITMQESLARCHRDLPETKVWGYNGLFPGPTIIARKNRTVTVRHINHLPINHSRHGTGTPHAAMGEMLPAIHLHGADVPPESDGHPDDGIPFQGGFRDYLYPNRQRGCAMWYHDHTHGLTGERVCMGLAGLYFLVDKSVEAPLRLPAGRREVPLVIQDRIFGADGQFKYEINEETLQSGYLGDAILVNGVVNPFFEVETAKYRFRILNGSNARIYRLSLDSGAPLIQIGTDGGLLQRPKPQASIEIAPSERLDVIIDFSETSVGSKIVLENLNGAGRTASIMRFNVSRKVKDTRKVPPFLAPWEEVPERESVGVREIRLARQLVDHLLTWTLNGKAYAPGGAPLASPILNTVEHWKFINPTNHPHPMHVHLVQFQIVNINGEPQEPSDFGWKDTVVVPPSSNVTVVARFSSYAGKYVLHCHNLEHEDFAMMADFVVVPPGALRSP